MEVRLHRFLTSTIWRVVISLKLLAVWVGRNRLDAEAKKGKSSKKSFPSQGLKPVVHKICELCCKLHVLYSVHSMRFDVTVARIRHLRAAHTVYLYVLCGSQNKLRLFPYTTLTDWLNLVESIPKCLDNSNRYRSVKHNTV